MDNDVEPACNDVTNPGCGGSFTKNSDNFHSESENEARLVGSLPAQSAVIGDSMAGEKVDRRYRDVAIEGHTAMD